MQPLNCRITCQSLSDQKLFVFTVFVPDSDIALEVSLKTPLGVSLSTILTSQEYTQLLPPAILQQMQGQLSWKDVSNPTVLTKPCPTSIRELMWDILWCSGYDTVSNWKDFLGSNSISLARIKSHCGNPQEELPKAYQLIIQRAWRRHTREGSLTNNAPPFDLDWGSTVKQALEQLDYIVFKAARQMGLTRYRLSQIMCSNSTCYGTELLRIKHWNDYRAVFAWLQDNQIELVHYQPTPKEEPPHESEQ